MDIPLVRALLNLPLVSRVRRNHGLEHAALHVLAHKYPGLWLAGYSGPDGFWLIGDVPIEVVQEAIEEALGRLRAGEYALAVHPNCGTNFVTAGIFAGLAAGFSMMGAGRRTRDKLERLPLAMALATLAVLVGYPLGLQLQERVTTSGQPGNLRVVEILVGRKGRFTAYRVRTRG